MTLKRIKSETIKICKCFVKSLSMFGMRGYLYMTDYVVYRICSHFGISCKKGIRLRRLQYCAAGGKRDLYYRSCTSDVLLVESIFVVTKEYDIPLDSEKFDAILDLGANIGLFSILYAERFKGKRIIAIEPEQENYQMLQKNTKAYQDSLITVQSGIWWRPANLELIDRGDSWSFMVKEASQNVWGGNKTSITMPGIDIDSLCERFHIAGNLLVKMDIEGTEKEIFEHIRDTKWLDRTAYLIMEIHDDDGTELYKNICGEMKKRGYWMSENGENIVFERAISCK